MRLAVIVIIGFLLSGCILALGNSDGSTAESDFERCLEFVGKNTHTGDDRVRGLAECRKVQELCQSSKERDQ